MAPLAGQLDIVIIGGSLSGVLTAVLLNDLPNVKTITILERLQLDGMRSLGAGIRVNEEVVDVFREVLGVAPEEYATKFTTARFLDRDSNILREIPSPGGWTTSWGPLYRFLRNRIDKNDKCVFRHGCSLENLVELNESSVKIEFTNESGEKDSLRANLVLGNDGLSSKTRSLLLPSVQRHGAGYVIYRGITPFTKVSERSSEMMDRHISYYHPPLDGQILAFNVTGETDDGKKGEDVINWIWYMNKKPEDFKSLMTDRHGKQHQFLLPHGAISDAELDKFRNLVREQLPVEFVDVICNCDETFVQVITDGTPEKLSFMSGKVLLIGDSAGGQRPHSASAVMQACYHCLLLKQYLQGQIDVSKWETEAVDFSKDISEAGRATGDALMSEGPASERTANYGKCFSFYQTRMNEKWKQNIGIGNAQILF